MSKLDNQIKELQARKSKVECLVTVKKQVFEAVKEYKAIGTEVRELVDSFIDAQVDIIENGETPSLLSDNEFSKGELEVLHQLILRATPKVAKGMIDNSLKNPESFTPIEKDNSTPVKPTAAVPDKIQFALANKHLDNKQVKVDVNGVQVIGVVVGLDAPHVIVKTATGQTVQVTLDKITA